ncbi:MAG: ABC transporter permease [Phaeodactylibacter sp.]|nr:ABC transporter permease [Phaeodactylibacter sp.]MCB9277126.1 ABC transporter permease [Lewinellaceae bacterium]
MFRSYLRTAARNLLKHKGFTTLNILGLAIGSAVFLLIAQYVKFERSYEAFIPGADNIYRLKLERYQNGELLIATAENVPGAGPALLAECPEVEAYARLYNLGYKNNLIITNEEAQPEPIAFKHRHFLYADSAFLPMMGYEMVSGDPATALAEPLTAVISEAYAEKYFGAQGPMGRRLHMQDDDFNDETVQVTGVFKNLPQNTHLKFDVLFSYKTLLSRGDWAPARYNTAWGRNDMYTFVKLKPGAQAAALEARFPAIIEKYNPQLAENNRKDVITLQPLRSIHLYSNLAEEPEPNGDGRIVLFMSVIGLLVLVIAWINYVNLSTARALERAREVGVRKATGAAKGQLIGQFLIESALANLIATVLAFALALLSFRGFNQLAGLQLSLSYLVQPWALGLLAVIWLAGTFLSGLYPAWVLSSFQPVAVLKGQFKNTARGLVLRQALVTLQFAASIALIAGAIIIYRQLSYMLGQDIGMNINQVLVVERPGIVPRGHDARNSAIDVFRSELAKQPGIYGPASSVTVPGKQREYKAAVKRMGAPDDESATLRFNSMDYHFMDIFDMKLLAGRAFSPDFPHDPDTSCIITQSAVRMLGFDEPEDAVGQTLSIPGFQWNPIVAGVVNDYHQVSLKNAMEPTVFYCSPYSGEFFSMRLTNPDIPGTISHIRQAWARAFPGNPFDYFFLDDYFAAQYDNEQRFGSLALVFALLAILIGCLGLFGLSGYAIAQRTKEIGIRKVLGASTSGIVGLLSRDFLKLVAVSILIASPLAYYFMEQWLRDFAYRINISLWVFALAGMIAVAIALLAVSFQSIRAALANPVEALRSE